MPQNSHYGVASGAALGTYWKHWQFALPGLGAGIAWHQNVIELDVVLIA
jgi:hypothetical protein